MPHYKGGICTNILFINLPLCIIRGFALCCAQARWDERGKLQNALPAMLGSVLGSKALQIEHVGSTSVPGLCAKPIIDILLVVKNSADEPSYVPALEAAGYRLQIREPEWFEHRMFKGLTLTLITCVQ